MNYEDYMKECFSLAQKAQGEVSPNPLVGALIVKDDIIIGKGYHHKAGEDHAEIDAIKDAGQDLTGATLICNLEPCCHTNKRTPPCTQRILNEGISKVVISTLDPNPEVAGKGVRMLQAAGVEVVTDILRKEGEKLNEVFFTHITHKRPFIHLKWAQTLDGKLATLSFDSKWITSNTAREQVHRERALYDAVAVGAATIEKDDPLLTIRLDDEEICKNRIIFAQGEMDKNFNVFRDKFKGRTTVIKNSAERSLLEILKEIYTLGICSMYIEGGPKTINRFLEAEMFDKVSVYIAPKLLGAGLSPFLKSPLSIQESVHLQDMSWEQFADDIRLTAYRSQ